jgi:N-acetylglucosaminyldiphosphoundecaprenol N-acetyl-beta-D-mannosaminyltransferase
MTINNQTDINNTISILGVRVDNVDRKQALNKIEQLIVSRNGGGAGKIFFTNVHSIHIARRNDDFRSNINSADLALPDGSGLKIAGKIQNTPIQENLNGTDFTPELLRIAEQRRWSVYLYGAESAVLEACRQNIHRQYPHLAIVGAQHGYVTMMEQKIFLNDINEKKPDIILVALGTPNQELWIARHAAELNAGVCMAVGGLFDFMGGRHPRAPRWMRSFGIEWLYRFLQDPKGKADRVFVEIPVFLFVVVTRWLFSSRTDNHK